MKTAIISRAMTLMFGLALVAVIWSAFSGRAPMSQSTPQMAEHPVVMPDGQKLYVQKYETSVAEWNACHAAGACALKLRVAGNRTEDEMPATGLSYPDIGQYLVWINATTGQKFRLPTLQEWEYMAAPVLPQTPDPIFSDPELSWASAYLLEPQTKRTLQPRGNFATTAEGIVDLNGSVWEWTDDCYAGVGDGTFAGDNCPAFYVGGEHIAAIPFLVSDPARGGCAVGVPPAHLGMRLVSDRPV